MSKRMGRPPKPPEEHYVTRSIRFPPDVWQEFSALVAAGQRGKVLQWSLRQQLDRLKREAKRRGVSVDGLVREMVREEQRLRQIDRLKAQRPGSGSGRREAEPTDEE